jgi:hypothetical protein
LKPAGTISAPLLPLPPAAVDPRPIPAIAKSSHRRWKLIEARDLLRQGRGFQNRRFQAFL